MKALILAGGFAKRMWPLTKEKPKALLPLKGKVMLEHVLKKMESLEDIEQVYISVNKKFEEQFSRFLQRYKSKKSIRLVVEPALGEGEKLGSVGGIKYFMDTENIEEPLLVMAGDNVFESGLFGMMMLYKKKKSPVVGLFDVGDRGLATNYGIAEIDSKGLITDFEEKPREPKSTLISTGIYILTAPATKRIYPYLAGNSGDRMGDFIKWLTKQEKVYGFVLSGKWFDIGSPEEYERAEKELE